MASAVSMPQQAPVMSMRSLTRWRQRRWLLARADDLEHQYRDCRSVLGTGLVHGDAHTGNLLPTPGGLVLIGRTEQRHHQHHHLKPGQTLAGFVSLGPHTCGLHSFHRRNADMLQSRRAEVSRLLRVSPNRSIPLNHRSEGQAVPGACAGQPERFRGSSLMGVLAGIVTADAGGLRDDRFAQAIASMTPARASATGYFTASRHG